ncbi:MAG TPA: (deoxy)nucleoside triphosphate pyrophosphohydrolase [Candidatus Binatia bacterium]|nr:(deoxy)nucleoside triphosphate pyrophosphohydrolase [Candidatus Binatia bacterium]
MTSATSAMRRQLCSAGSLDRTGGLLSQRAMNCSQKVKHVKPPSRTAISVIAGLIFRNERILICQRRQNAAFASLKWEFPGGKIEDRETDTDALRRELKEELAIDVRESEFFSGYVYSYEDGPTVSLRFHRVKSFQGEPQNLVFEQVSWVEVDDLVNFDFLEGDRRLIMQMIERQDTFSKA